MSSLSNQERESISVKDKISTPVIIGAIAGILVLVGIVGYLIFRPAQSAVSAADAPAYSKQGGASSSYGSTYGQNPTNKQPPGMSAPPGASDAPH